MEQQLMSPSSRNGWKAHIVGIRQIIRLSGPDCFSSRIPYQLFNGIRPLIVSKDTQRLADLPSNRNLSYWKLLSLENLRFLLRENG